VDIGSMTPGLCPLATNWFGEGIKFPPVKLVREGEIDNDIFNIFLTNVRTPNFQAHDLTAEIAAVSYAREKVPQLADRYGTDVLKSSYEEIIKFGEEKARSRIQMIPDGVYEYIEYMDYDQIHAIRCRLSVEGDTMSMDFTGTDHQAQASINAAPPCAIANIHNIYTCMLLPDFLANEGCFKPFKINLPPGTVLSCLPPAACAGASTQGGWKAQCAAIGVFSKALNCSNEWYRATAGWGAGIPSFIISGMNQLNENYTLFIMDGNLQGGGARATKDGVDTSNIAGSTNTSVPNIETHEQRYPMLYLYRRYSRDSGGPGKYRGGLGGEYAFKPHGVESLEAICCYIGEVIPANPILGGYPGATVHIFLKKNTNVNELLASRIPSFEELSGNLINLGHKNEVQDIGYRDVILSQCQGGGGYGDPLERDPELVAIDVKRGLVSLKQAIQAYGVLLNDSHEVQSKSEEVRQKIRKERLESSIPLNIWRKNAKLWVGERINIEGYLESIFDDNGMKQIRCGKCKYTFEDSSDGWLRDVKVLEVSPSYFAGNIKEDKRVKFILYLCPNCGRMIETQTEASSNF
jgi:N-methylhydantoinase B